MVSSGNNVVIRRAVVRVLAASFAAAAPVVYAQSARAPEAVASQANSLDEIVVTASGGDKTKLESSISVSSVSLEAVRNFVPRSEAEVLRMIPGLNLQDTAGPGGNSNIGVRGIPVSTGGSEYVALQEDGLPVTLFGDIQFGNNDYWVRFDNNVDRVEAVRGGSAATFASQAPGAVINYVSKTGTVDGGSIGLSEGLNFNESRIDFDYGGHLSDTVRFHIGGFAKDGKGPTDIGYTAEKGYQIKANLTKEFNDGNGYVRFNFKRLDDQEPTFTSMPSLVTVSGGSLSGFSQIPGVDPRVYSSTGIYNQTFQVLNAGGAIQNVQMQGIHPQVTSFGVEFHNQLAGGLVVDDKLRWMSMSGVFSNQWTGETLLSTIVGAPLSAGGPVVASLRYAAGPNQGSVYTSQFVNSGAQAYVNMKDMGSFVNDLNLKQKFSLGADSALDAKLGWFHMSQNIDQDWRINNAILSLNSSGNPVPLDAFSASGAQLTANGLTGFNNQWGGCCGGRQYNLTYTDDAPNLDLDFKVGKFDLDASARYDSVSGSGSSYGPAAGANVTITDALGPAVSIPTYNTSTTVTDTVDYRVHYTSWSVGALYDVTKDLTAFARASRGGRANADRMLYSGDFNKDGSLNAGGQHNAVNYVDQQEVGVKNRGTFADGGSYNLEATVFGAQVTEHNYDFTHQFAIDTVYHSYGLESYGAMHWNNWVLDGSLVYTHSVNTETNQTPTAMPRWTYRISPAYDTSLWAAGITVNGQSSSPTCCGQYYFIPGNTYVNGFVYVRPYDGLEVGLTVNNVFDKLGYRGTGSLTVTGLPGNQAVFDNSAMLGRTLTASIRYRF